MTNSTARAVIDVGSVIADTYVIEALLGRGGMGAVFLASHRRLAGKRVAIKILHTEIEDPDIVARFKREAEIAAKLNHPNIVGVIDYNVAPDGTPYLVLDYLEGETLAQCIARGPMPLDHVFSIVRQVGSALAAAHRGGIVHRDLKPQNIFLVSTEVDGRHVEIAKVLDFGISKIRGSQTVKTQDSTLLGTPQYMAPEQATGQHANVDERTDVFALGAIVYEMLSGRPAFSGASIPEVVFKVVYEQPAPLAQQVPTLPPAITSAIAQAMAKPSDERFPTVAGFVEAVTGQPLTLSRGAAAGPASAPALAAESPSTGRRMASGDAFAQTMGSGDHGPSPVNPLLATAAPGTAAPIAAASGTAGTIAAGTHGGGGLAAGTSSGPRAPTAASASASAAAGSLGGAPPTPGASVAPVIAAAPTVDMPSLRGEPPARRRSGMIAAIALVGAAAIGGGIYAATRSPSPPNGPIAGTDDRRGSAPGPRTNAGLPPEPSSGGDAKGLPPRTGDTSGANAGDTKVGDAPTAGNPTAGKPTTGNPTTGNPTTGNPTTGNPTTGNPTTGNSTAGNSQAGDSKAGDAKVGDAKAGDAKAGDAKASDAKAGDAKASDAKAGDAKAGDAKAGGAKDGDAKAGDAKAGDAKARKPGTKPDPRLKPKNPGAGVGRPDDDVEGDEDAGQKLAQASAALDRHDYDQTERLANTVINAPGSPRQHATARMIHGIVQCAARNDQEAANIDLRSLERFRNLRARMLSACRTHGMFTTR